MRLSAPLYLFDQKDSSLKVVPLGSEPFSVAILLINLAVLQAFVEA